jgi:hypothetical protein
VWNWCSIDWQRCYEIVARGQSLIAQLQHGIVVAYKNADKGTLKLLQNKPEE